MRYAIIQVAGKPVFTANNRGSTAEGVAAQWQRETAEGAAYLERFRVLQPWTPARQYGKGAGSAQGEFMPVSVTYGFDQASYGYPKGTNPKAALGGLLLVAENDYGDFFATFVHPRGGAENFIASQLPPMNGGDTAIVDLEEVLGWFDVPSPLSQSLNRTVSQPASNGYIKKIYPRYEEFAEFHLQLQTFAAPAPGGTTNLVFMPRLASRYDIVDVLGLPTTEGITLFDAITEQLVASPLDVSGGLPFGTPGIGLGAPGGSVDSGTITSEPGSEPSITSDRLSPDGFQQDITGDFDSGGFVQGPSVQGDRIIPDRSNRPNQPGRDVLPPEPDRSFPGDGPSGDELGDDPFHPPDFESSDDDLSLGDDEGVETKDNSALALAALAGALLLMRG